MTYFVPGLVIGFLLGACAFGVLALLMLSFKRPAPPPTKFRRKYRDAEIVATVAKSEPVEPIYIYNVMGLGEDR